MDLSCKTCSPTFEGDFTMILRSKFVRGAPASVKSPMIALLCGSEIKVGAAATELGILECSEDNWKLGRYYKGTYFLNDISIY